MFSAECSGLIAGNSSSGIRIVLSAIWPASISAGSLRAEIFRALDLASQTGHPPPHAHRSIRPPESAAELRLKAEKEFPKSAVDGAETSRCGDLGRLAGEACFKGFFGVPRFSKTKSQGGQRAFEDGAGSHHELIALRGGGVRSEHRSMKMNHGNGRAGLNAEIADPIKNLV